jgi:hypothetical protein
MAAAAAGRVPAIDTFVIGLVPEAERTRMSLAYAAW